MIEVDARGRSCPEPVVMTKKALDRYDGQEIVVLVDTNVAKENVSRLAKNSGFTISLTQEGEDIRITCTK
ncbi:sulfurtransferase TusA family protein [Clostridia bacterium]|nr:sulfurtransferase TusA family protein [Clostridia bacterium]